MAYPTDFRWGVSTAAYQIEGGALDGGRGRSIWDTFSHTEGRIADGSTGDTACDHYHRYPEDIELMAALGINAYRFSIAWTRIQPDGDGPVNPAGVAFYDHLVDALLDHGIDPVVTLFHWDLPQALQDRGGWLNRDTAHRFAQYADHVGAALGDRVKLWITLNEPFVHTVFGHAMGVHAPGQTLLLGALPTAHHQLLGHGLAVAALRGRSQAPITIANNYSPVWPASDSEADHAAAAAYDALHNRLFTEPLLGRGYPDGFDLPIADGDLTTIAAPIDGLGVNYYFPTAIRAPGPDVPLPFELAEIAGYPRTDFDWPIVPQGLTDTLLDLHQRYQQPMWITESGCAVAASPHDPTRVDYLAAHTDAVHAAISAGADVRGYFVWSLLDNFEWAEGYTKRFGLVHVDFDTQRRTPRDSYHWYRRFIADQRG